MGTVPLHPRGLFELGVKSRGQVCQRNFKQQTPARFKGTSVGGRVEFKPFLICGAGASPQTSSEEFKVEEDP